LTDFANVKSIPIDDGVIVARFDVGEMPIAPTTTRPLAAQQGVPISGGTGVRLGFADRALQRGAAVLAARDDVTLKPIQPLAAIRRLASS
jgi:hypothetical protein